MEGGRFAFLDGKIGEEERSGAQWAQMGEAVLPGRNPVLETALLMAVPPKRGSASGNGICHA